MKVLSKPVYVTYTGYLKYDLIEVGSFTRNTKTPGSATYLEESREDPGVSDLIREI